MSKLRVQQQSLTEQQNIILRSTAHLGDIVPDKYNDIQQHLVDKDYAHELDNQAWLKEYQITVDNLLANATQYEDILALGQQLQQQGMNTESLLQKIENWHQRQGNFVSQSQFQSLVEKAQLKIDALRSLANALNNQYRQTAASELYTSSDTATNPQDGLLQYYKSLRNSPLDTALVIALESIAMLDSSVFALLYSEQKMAIDEISDNLVTPSILMLQDAITTIQTEYPAYADSLVRQLEELKTLLYGNAYQYSQDDMSFVFTPQSLMGELYQQMSFTQETQLLGEALDNTLLPIENYLDQITKQVQQASHRFKQQADQEWQAATKQIGVICLVALLIIFVLAWLITRNLWKQSKQAVESEDRFRSMFDMTPDPAWIMINERIVESNQAAASKFKALHTSLNGQSIASLSPSIQANGKATLDEHYALLDAVKETGRGKTEWLFKGEQHKPVYADMALVTVTYQNQEAILCIWRDITKRQPTQAPSPSYPIPLEQAVKASGSEQQQSKEATESAYQTSEQSNSKRVLLVNNNNATRDMLIADVNTLGLGCDAVKNVHQAIDKIRKAEQQGQTYQLILIDWQLSATDGVEASRQILSSIAEAPPVIIMAPTHRMNSVKANAAEKDLNITGFLTKPVTLPSLFDAIALSHRDTNGNPVTISDEEYLATDYPYLYGAKVLLVEDNDINRELAAELLRKHQVDLSLATNGAEALEKIAEQAFDLVLMDCQMPIMDGYQATQIIRQDNQFDQLPIIALTGNAFNKDMDKVHKAGMNDHITKPIDIHSMFNTMSKWLSSDTSMSHTLSLPTRNAALISEFNAYPLPDMPQLDTYIGLKHALSHHLYIRMLQRFTEKQQDFIGLFEQAVAKGAMEDARRHCHTLKSIAATLGMHYLSELAKQLEENCTQQEAKIALQSELDTILSGLLIWQRGIFGPTESTDPQIHKDKPSAN
ncbi:hypothetical protein THO17_21170 [Marinomonas sp. THO17]